MKIAIDASNIKSDGGIVHLFELINNFEFKKTKIKKIVIWGSNEVLKKIKKENRIQKIYLNEISNSLIKRFFWQFIYLPNKLKKMNFDIFFVLGGFFFRKKIKTVSLFQNILPFIEEDVRKYEFFERIKLLIQKKLYLNSFRNSDGIIFLSNFSKNILKKNINLKRKKTEIIPHGVSSIFKFKKKKILKNKIKMLYVSKLDIYKNQLKIISVINYLKKKFDITLSLIGSYDKKNKKILLNEIKKYNLSKNIKILGKIDYHKLPKIYHKHDIKIYASKSETFGMTMLEAIKSGLPVLAIKNQISKEILSEAGFFCYNSTKNIQNTILKIINNKKLLKKKIILGKKIAEKYNWKITSKKTFNFLEKVRG